MEIDLNMMKKLTLIAAAILMLTACTKDNDTLENTTWMWFLNYTSTSIETGEVYDIHLNSFEIKFDSPSHGYAHAREYKKIHFTNDTIGTYYIYGMFSVSYTYDGEKKEGTITFTKEHCEGVNYSDEYLSSLWNDPITSSFYTYADDSIMFIYTTPNRILEHMDLKLIKK